MNYKNRTLDKAIRTCDDSFKCKVFGDDVMDIDKLQGKIKSMGCTAAYIKVRDIPGLDIRVPGNKVKEFLNDIVKKNPSYRWEIPEFMKRYDHNNSNHRMALGVRGLN